MYRHSGSNSGKRILDARVLGPHSWLKLIAPIYFQQQTDPQNNSPSRNSPPKTQPRNLAKNDIALLRGHLPELVFFPWYSQKMSQVDGSGRDHRPDLLFLAYVP